MPVPRLPEQALRGWSPHPPLADGGETRLSNLALLCRFHHRQVHEGGVTIQVLDDGALRFTMKDGRSFDSLVPARLGQERSPHAEDVLQGDWTHLLAQNATDIVITATTAVTQWRGERMDYDIAVDALLRRSARRSHAVGHGTHVSAETSASSCGGRIFREMQPISEAVPVHAAVSDSIQNQQLM